MIVDVPALADEELIGSRIAVNFHRAAAYLLLPRRGEVAPGALVARLHHVGEQQRRRAPADRKAARTGLACHYRRGDGTPGSSERPAPLAAHPPRRAPPDGVDAVRRGPRSAPAAVPPSLASAASRPSPRF